MGFLIHYLPALPFVSNLAVALFLSAAIFGVAHLHPGAPGMLQTAFMALVFGVVFIDNGKSITATSSRQSFCMCWWIFASYCFPAPFPPKDCYYLKEMMQNKFRLYTGDYLIVVEVAIYTILALLLSATGLLALTGAAKLLWDGVRSWSMATSTLRILDQLLLVLMLVEILHTVRISIRSHSLITEPFLVVGLIASIRRMLVITQT